jgi:phage shock protein PspC (stress-responsive transcriptional regulator)
MTTTPPEAPSGPNAPQDQGPRVSRDEVRDLGRLRRSVTDRKIAGVAGGLARHLDIDPVILRVAFVVLVFFGGAGLILYGACWLLVPEEGSESAPLHLDDRSRAVALVLVGVVAALALLGDTWGASWFPWPLAVIALLVVLFVSRKDRGRTPPAPAYGPPTAEAAAAAYAPGTEGSYPPPTYAPPAYPPTDWAAPVRPRSPRRRGPVLFWFTLALIALAEGVLGIVDLAGVAVAAPAYPALAVGITGLMLLVGAFWGRAGGLILVGLVATAVLAGTSVADNWEGERLERTPTRAADVDGTYRISTGELVLDLRRVHDLPRLDGRTVHVAGDVGRLEVIVPDGLDADVHADVDGPGNINLFSEETGGIDLVMDRTHDGGAGAPELTIDADLSVGQIEVHQR